MNRFELRLENVRKQLKANEALFAILPEDVGYLTGFTGDSAYCLITGDELYFITDGRFTQQYREETQVNGYLMEVSPGNSLTKVLAELISGHTIQTLLLNPDDVRVSMMRKIEGDIPEIRFKYCEVIREMRMIKDEIEIETIRRNIRITELGYHYILRNVEEGKTEIETAAMLEHYLRIQGAEKMSFDTICASGPRSALPHGLASMKKIEKNEIVLFDFGILKDGYCSDFTRCLYFGKILGSEFDKIHRIVLEALKAAQRAIRPGIPAKLVHMAAFDVIDRAGYGAFFTHSTGHGVGMEIHEAPRITTNSETVLSEGMVFTVEPGIYLPGKGGVRLEDVVAVRKDGAEVLTHTSYDL
ncbi:MAG: aminopeptidase P family protein [Brevinematales bacterium]|nr:aminopeptidase P family protein [Brevinematales bacterium]